jgi:diguanylate cyclase (GGDEF)-like protein
VDDTLTEFRRLQRRMSLLEDQVRSNEHIWSGFRRIELDMVAARSLGEVLEVLVNGILRTSSAVGCVTVAWIDQEYELIRMLERESEHRVLDRLVPVSAEHLTAHFGGAAPRPWLGPYDPAHHDFLFRSLTQPCGSVAIVPLILKGELVGSLNQGARGATHFGKGAATDLLEHLAAITALSIDNAVSHERLKLDGLTDPLTGIANRRFFERRLREELGRRQRSGSPLSLIVVDIDFFKRVNDDFGHQVGDAVLVEVARVLGLGLRTSDLLGRYGGEEFVLLLPGTSIQKAGEIAERLRTQIASMRFDMLNRSVTVSVGVAVLAGSDGDAEAGSELFRRADHALYRAKGGGRNRVVLDGS